MNKLRKTTVLACLALFAASGCADLDVTNQNAPDRERALATAGDVESLVAGSFHSWWLTNENNNGPVFFLSAASFQHSGWPANFGTVEYSAFPRGELVNSTADSYYGYVAYVWEENYSALAAIRDGLQAVENNPDVADELSSDPDVVERLVRLRAYGKFMQGLAHATIAMVYDQGFVIDETNEEDTDPELLPYDQLMERAVGDGGYFDQAIDIASDANFTIPSSWMSREVTAATLVELAHTMKARYMAAVARTPAERESVDWTKVKDELAAGVGSDFNINLQGHYSDGIFKADPLGYWSLAAWQQLNYFILGMADQSNDYHDRWLSQPISQRVPHPNDDPILIQTPDERFPVGTTLEEQIGSPGTYYAVPHADSPCASSAFSIGNSHSQPSRGQWRWSYYFDVGLPGCNYENYVAADNASLGWGLITMDEIRLLEAEADLRLGNAGAAAAAVNETRVQHGLNATDASGTNTSCVPKLPDKTCGDLMEMLKWEKRLETRYHGPLSNGWYFDGRGWGDLYQGTYLHLPIPEEDLLLLDMPVYTTGSGESAAGTSVYNWPGES